MSFASAKLTAMTSKLHAQNPPAAPVSTLSPSVSSTAPIRNDDCTEVGSPTSVTMVGTSSSDSAAMEIPLKASSASSRGSALSIPKPFFVMDWLEEIDPRDLEMARQMLQTPQKRPGFLSTPDLRTPVTADSASSSSQKDKCRSAIALPSLAHRDAVCRQLYPPTPSTVDGTNDRAPSVSTLSMSRSTSATSTASSALTNPPVNAAPAVVKMSPFKRKSIAIGNGWNAKGLHKAKKGSWESALQCWRNALEIREQVLGNSHPDTANTLNNCGIALGKLGRFDGAIEVLERALEIRAKHYGTREHPEVAATLHNIGNVLHQAQDRAGAIQCFWDAKLLQEHILGPNHVQVARTCVAIGNVYYEALQYDDAREAYYDALQVFADAGLAEDHTEVLAIQQDIQDIEAAVAAHPYNQGVQQMMAYHHPHFHCNHHHHPSHYPQDV